METVFLLEAAIGYHCLVVVVVPVCSTFMTLNENVGLARNPFLSIHDGGDHMFTCTDTTTNDFTYKHLSSI